MLRDIRGPFLNPRLVNFAYTVDTNTVTFTEGTGDISGTSAATGSAVLKYYRAFGRNSIVVANTSSADVAAGGFVCLTATPSATGMTLISKNPSNAADDGTVYGIALGFDNRDGTCYSRRAAVLQCRDARTRIQAFRVDTSGSGSIVVNARNATLTRNGTGDVTLTFRSAFGTPTNGAIATPVGSTCAVCQIAAMSAKAVQVKCFNSGGVAADAVFNLIVVGDDSRQTGADNMTPVRSDQRKPIIFGWTVAYTSGVPAYVLNSGFATLADTNTGRATFTFNQAFARTPIVCCMPTQAGSAMKRAQIDSCTSTGFEVKYFSSAPALEDPADTYGFHVIGVGFDDASEY